MASEPSTYQELAKAVLRDYLRSAVIIDDQWRDSANDLEEGGIDESDLIADEWIDDGLSPYPDGTQGDLAPPRPVHNIEDTRLLVGLQQALVGAGLLACGFRYTRQARSTAIELARRADIVVLDWHLAGDDGAEALKILADLRGNDLTFVCIFTGHGRVQEVRQALLEQLGDGKSVAAEDGPDLRIENLVVAIRKKGGLSAEDLSYTVTPEGLLDAAVGGLTRSYNGLVQLTLLEFTRLHRRHLPKILERLDKSLDAAVLLEAGDNLSPVDQKGVFLAVLIDEWRAYLERDHSELRALGPRGRRLHGTALAQELAKIPVKELEDLFQSLGVNKQNASELVGPAAGLHEWLRGGCVGAVVDSKKQAAYVKIGILRAATSGLEAGHSLPHVRLDALFHQQLELPSQLTQGSLVAYPGDKEDRYYLCITPACDADRPENIGNLFTFLETRPIDHERLLKKQKQPLKGPYLVVDDEGDLRCLEVLLKQRIVLEVQDPAFEPKGLILGHFTLGDGEVVGGAVALRRVAQLRAEHALSITVAAAADAARVGVNRVELVRWSLG